MKRLAKVAAAAALTGLFGDEAGRVRLKTLRGPARGLRFGLDLRTRMEFPYWLGRYDAPVLSSLTRICRPGWTVWDCGTYLGYYTCLLARLVGASGRVIAVEPDPENLARTQENVALNGLTNVRFEQAAIGGVSGPAELLRSANTNSHLPGTYVGRDRESYAGIERIDATTPVTCLTFDDACFARGLDRPNLVKVDIEGAEGLALRSSARFWVEARPILVLELHNPDCDLAAWLWATEYRYALQDMATGRLVTAPNQVGGTLLCRPIES